MENGIKVLVHEVRRMSKQGLAHWRPDLRSKYAKKCSVFIPLKPVLFIPFDINTKEKLAELLYTSFGATPEGTTYCLRYWWKRGRWSRRLRRLCMLKLFDLPDGRFKAQWIDLKNLSKMHWWRG